ncbi:hypothetical protein ACOMHN_039019 [Nucella lapillus]
MDFQTADGGMYTILNIHWSDIDNNVEILEHAEITSIEAALMRTRLRWAEDVSRIEEHRLLNITLRGQVGVGGRGSPKKR